MLSQLRARYWLRSCALAPLAPVEQAEGSVHHEGMHSSLRTTRSITALVETCRRHIASRRIRKHAASSGAS